MKEPLGIALGVAAIATTLPLILLVAALRGPLNDAPKPVPSGPADAASAKADPTSRLPAPPPARNAGEPAKGQLASHDEKVAARTLEEQLALSTRFPDDDAVKRMLVQGYADRQRLLDAVTTLDSFSKNLSDPAMLAILLRAVRSGDAKTEDASLNTLARLGGAGPLFELSVDPKATQSVRDRATALTRSDAVYTRADEALQVAISLRDRPPCDRKDLFGWAEAKGDGRSLPFLQPLMTRTGCSFRKLYDCFECLGNRRDLEKALGAIAARQK